MNDGDLTAAKTARSREWLTYDQAFARIRARLSRVEYPAAVALATDLARDFPGDFDAQLMAGQCLLQSGEATPSLVYIERAMTLRVDSAPALFFRSRAQEYLNRHGPALASINQALAIDPENPEYLTARGSIYMSVGDREHAVADFLRALDIDKRCVGALLKLSVIPGYRLSREQIRMAEFLVRSGQLQQEPRGTAHFALAGAYEALGKRERQFEHLHAGNGIFRRLYNYQPGEFSDHVSQMIEFFPASLFSSRAIAGSTSASASSARLVFIVGMPRSGSTLVEQILCSHSRVVTVGENNHLANAIRDFEQDFRFPDIDERSLQAFPRIAQRYLDSVGPVEAGGVIVDKTLANYMLSGVLRLLFPNARFIYTQRNPVATCYGAYKRMFSPGNVTFTYDLAHLAARYRDTTRMVRHWLEVMPERYLALDYEALVENQAAVTRDILEFCDLPWEQACLNFHENASAVASASKMQVKQKIYTTAVDEWRQYRDYLEPLMRLLDEGCYPV